MTWDSMVAAEQNGLVKQTSKSNSQQDPAKHQAEDNDMGFNGYVSKMV